MSRSAHKITSWRNRQKQTQPHQLRQVNRPRYHLLGGKRKDSVKTTLGDEEIFLFLKPENEIKIDAYSRHFKEDLHWEGPIQENLNLVSGFPRRKSHGTNFWRRVFCVYHLSQESATKTRLLAAQAVAKYPLSTYDTNTYRTP
eukprot:scaffold27035_cov51-Attheya_sp.AAC.1